MYITSLQSTTLLTIIKPQTYTIVKLLVVPSTIIINTILPLPLISYSCTKSNSPNIYEIVSKCQLLCTLLAHIDCSILLHNCHEMSVTIRTAVLRYLQHIAAQLSTLLILNLTPTMTFTNTCMLKFARTQNIPVQIPAFQHILHYYRSV